MVFPALGCGSLEYCAKYVAETAVLRIREFETGFPGTSLQNITFIVPEDDEHVYKVNENGDI